MAATSPWPQICHTQKESCCINWHEISFFGCLGLSLKVPVQDTSLDPAFWHLTYQGADPDVLLAIPYIFYSAQSTKDFISGMGLGMIADQLADLKLGELLDTPPPGLDEAVAIAKVCCAMASISRASPGHDHGSSGCKHIRVEQGLSSLLTDKNLMRRTSGHH